MTAIGNSREERLGTSQGGSTYIKNSKCMYNKQLNTTLDSSN